MSLMWMPLTMASEGNNVAEVQRLLDLGKDPNERDEVF
jgi:hypothetical protein